MADTLLTDRLTLRPFTADDLDDLVELDSDPEVMRYLTSGRATPREVIAAETLPRFMAPRGGVAVWAWAVVARQDDGFLGWASLRPPEVAPAQEAELGYRLRRAAWGQGLASEAARALIAHGFGSLDLQRVWAQTMAVNHASRRVMEKAGLAHVRTFHLDWDDPIPGTEEGEVEYAITSQDWLATR